MTRPISTRTHGVIDYAFSATLMTLPFALGWRGRAANLAFGAGLATLATSLMTNYELGAVKMLPMKAHGGTGARHHGRRRIGDRRAHEDAVAGRNPRHGVVPGVSHSTHGA